MYHRNYASNNWMVSLHEFRYMYIECYYWMLSMHIHVSEPEIVCWTKIVIYTFWGVFFQYNELISLSVCLFLFCFFFPFLPNMFILHISLNFDSREKANIPIFWLIFEIFPYVFTHLVISAYLLSSMLLSAFVTQWFRVSTRFAKVCCFNMNIFDRAWIAIYFFLVLIVLAKP